MDKPRTLRQALTFQGCRWDYCAASEDEVGMVAGACLHDR